MTLGEKLGPTGAAKLFGMFCKEQQCSRCPCNKIYGEYGIEACAIAFASQSYNTEIHELKEEEKKEETP